MMMLGGTTNLVTILIPQKRLSKLSHTARSKRPYDKTNNEYWNKGILVKRARTVSE